MDTTNKHIGNVLYNMSDKDIKEVFEQYAHKLGFDKFYGQWQDSMMHWLSNILYCNHFDYNGNVELEDDN